MWLALLAAAPFALTSTTPRPFDGYALLCEGWRFHPDDDPHFASPEVDDSSWAVIERGDTMIGLPAPHSSGWMRLRVSVSQDRVDAGEHLIIGNMLSAELYVDGKLRRVLGDVNAALRGERTEIHLAPELSSAFPFQKPGVYLLALRVATADAAAQRAWGANFGIAVLAGDRTAFAKAARQLRHNQAFALFFAGGA